MEGPTVPRAGHDAVDDVALRHRAALVRAEAVQTEHLRTDQKEGQLVAVDLDGAPAVALEVGQGPHRAKPTPPRWGRVGVGGTFSSSPLMGEGRGGGEFDPP